MKRWQLTYADRKEVRAANALDGMLPGWHNGPKLVQPKPRGPEDLHPEIRRYMDMMNRNMIQRDAAIRAEIARKLGQGASA